MYHLIGVGRAVAQRVTLPYPFPIAATHTQHIPSRFLPSTRRSHAIIQFGYFRCGPNHSTALALLTGHCLIFSLPVHCWAVVLLYSLLNDPCFFVAHPLVEDEQSVRLREQEIDRRD